MSKWARRPLSQEDWTCCWPLQEFLRPYSPKQEIQSLHTTMASTAIWPGSKDPACGDQEHNLLSARCFAARGRESFGGFRPHLQPFQTPTQPEPIEYCSCPFVANVQLLATEKGYSCGAERDRRAADIRRVCQVSAPIPDPEACRAEIARD